MSSTSDVEFSKESGYYHIMEKETDICHPILLSGLEDQVVSESEENTSKNWYHVIMKSLTLEEWRTILFLFSFVLGLHVVGWVTLLVFVAPQHYKIGETGSFGIGLGITAYSLGLRHAFDADHIAAIDNTTRKFMAEGKRPLSVGFWFSLGHSSVVFFAALIISLGLKSFAGQVQDSDSQLHIITGLIGSLVSGIFLCIIGVINLVILVDVIKVFMEMKKGVWREKELEEMLDSRGLMNRLLGKLAASIREPWHMYPLGFLFGLGFDTATEVALLFMAAGAATSGLPCYAILCLPVLFAAGMSLLDTIDGSFMNFAYGWAFSKPVRKVFYNIVITGLSVAVALVIGMIELIQVMVEKAGLKGSLAIWVASLDLNVIGFIIVGLFVLTWAVALSIWHFGKIEQRWSAGTSTCSENCQENSNNPQVLC